MPLITATTTALITIGIGAATAGVLAPIIVSTAASVGLSLLADALRPSDAVQQAGAGASGLEKELSYSTVFPRSWIVGRALTAGSHIYSQVSDVKPDGSKHSGPEQNRYYDTIICLADHECSSLHQIQVDDEFRTGADMATPGKMGSVIPGFERDGDARAWFKWFSGTEGQAADQRMVEASRVRGDSSLVWTNDHRLRGCAYVRQTFQFDEKRTKDWPESTYVVNGAKLYDLRKDSTNGGSGAHRYDQPGTWEFSRNPAVALGHLIRGFRFPGNRWLVGLQGVTADMLDGASFRAAADACADNVALKGGGSESRYLFGFEFPLELEAAAIAETLLSSMAGRLCWTGARWRLFAGVAQTPVVTITDADLVITEPREFDPRSGLAELVNRVTATYTEPAEDWSTVAAHPRSSSEDQEADGDRELTLELSLDGVPSGTQAQRIMEIARRASREQKRHRIAVHPQFLRLEVGDWIAWTSTRWGYGAKTFRVEQVEIAHDLTVFLHLAETSANVFAWTASVDELDKVVKDLAVGGDPDDDVNLALTLAGFVDEPGTRKAQAGISVTWLDPENRRIEMIEVEYKRDGGNRIYSERVDVDKLGLETTKGIRWDSTFRVRGRPRFRDGSWGAWTSPTLDGAPTVTTPDIPEADVVEKASGDNLVFNPSFERADPDTAGNPTEALGWTQGGDLGFLRASGNAEHGEWAMRRTRGGGALNNGFLEPVAEQRLETRVGQRHSATAQIKVTGGATVTALGIRIVYRDVAGAILALFSDSVSDPTGVYQQVSVANALAPAGTFSVNIRLFVDGQSSTGTVWWDAVSLRRNQKTRDLEDDSVSRLKVQALAIDDARIESVKKGKVWIDDAGLGARTLQNILEADGKVKRGEVKINSAGGERTLANFFDADGKGDGAEMKDVSIGNLKIVNDTISLQGNINGSAATINAGNSLTAIDVTIAVYKRTIFIVTLDHQSPNGSPSDPQRTNMDCELRIDSTPLRTTSSTERLPDWKSVVMAGSYNRGSAGNVRVRLILDVTTNPSEIKNVNIAWFSAEK